MLSREERNGLFITVAGGGALLLALLAGLGFFSDPPATEPPPATSPNLALGSVRGRVVAADDQRGLALRVITIEGVAGRSDHRVLPANATAPGAFEVRALPAGRCTLRLAADGYVDELRDVVVVAGGTVELPTVPLVALVTLAGRVVDADATPAGAGTVELVASSGEETRKTTVDEHGRFEFSRLLPAEWTLAAATSTKNGAVAEEASSDPPRDSSLDPLRIDARRGGEWRELELRVLPEFTLAGTIRWPIGDPPPRSVTIGGLVTPLAGDGRFRIAGQRAGSGRALIRDGTGASHERPFRLPAAAVDWSVPEPAQDSPTPARDEESPSVAAKPADAPPPAPYSTALPLRLVVRNRQGAGVPARLELRALDSELPVRIDATNRAGKATLAHWPSGSYRLLADGPTGAVECAIVLHHDPAMATAPPLELLLDDVP
jgi:hypothetical protein